MEHGNMRGPFPRHSTQWAAYRELISDSASHSQYSPSPLTYATMALCTPLIQSRNQSCTTCCLWLSSFRHRCRDCLSTVVWGVVCNIKVHACICTLQADMKLS